MLQSHAAAVPAMQQSPSSTSRATAANLLHAGV